MANMQINARLNFDTSQAMNELRNFQNAVGARGASGSSSDIISSSQNSINNSLEQRDIQKQTMEIMSQLLFAVQQNTLAMQGKMNSSQSGSGNGKGENDNYGRKFLSGVSLATGIYGGITAYQTSQRRAQILKENSDPFGAEIESLQGRNKALQTGTSILPMLGTIAGTFLPIGPLLGNLAGQALKDVLNAAGGANTESQISKLELEQSRTEKYRNDLGLFDKSLMSFGATNNARENRVRSLAMMQNYLTDSVGTGLDLSTYAGLAQGFAKYGVSNYEAASSLTKNAGLVARYTNTDINDVSKYLGTQYRYGNANGIDNLNYAYSAARASGLNKDQFGEFLTGLQSVIEEGISNGYEKNSDEISKTTLMLSSINKNWTGENGFIRYNKMDSGLRNATSLSSPEQMLVFSALQSTGMNSLDVLKTLENGLTVNSFGTISKAMNQQYGGSDLLLATAYRNLFGLSYNDADQVAKWSRSGSITQAQINSLGKGKANQSVATDNSELTDQQNKVKYGSEMIGTAQWNDYFSDVKIIAQQLKGSKDYGISKAQLTGKGAINYNAQYTGEAGMWKYLQDQGMLTKHYSNRDEDFAIRNGKQSKVKTLWDSVMKDGVVDDRDENLIKQIVELLRTNTKQAIFVQ